MKKNTKKYMILSLLLLLGTLYAVSRALGSDDSILYRGTIIHTHNDGFMTLLVDGLFETSQTTSSTVTEFSLGDDIRILQNNQRIDPVELKRGMYVDIKSSPEIRTSYPAQATALEVVILENQDSPLYMEAEVVDVLDQGQGIISTVHLKGNLQGYGEDTEIYVSVPEGSYYPFGLESSKDLLKSGDRVFVVFTGPIRESYPLQGTSSSIIIVTPATY